MKTFLFSAAMVALAFSLPPAPAVAAADPWAEPGPQTGGQALDPAPEDGELVDFVAAFVRLIGVQHGYMMLLQHEPDPSRAEELQNMAIADMEAAIKQDGMSIDRYNTIALAVREDPELQTRVEGIIEQLAADPSMIEPEGGQ